MTYSFEIEKTTRLVCTLAMIKENEIRLYKEKMLELKEVLNQHPNSFVHEYRYNLAKTRHDQLKRTIKGLRRLEQKIEQFT